MKRYQCLAAFSLLFAFSRLSASETWYAETLYPEWQQQLRMDKILKEEKTDLQDLKIFENGRMGRVLALDGVIQTTEADEFVYHEMMAHVPLNTHPVQRRSALVFSLKT